MGCRSPAMGSRSHPSPTARLCARCGGGPPPLWPVGAFLPARRFAAQEPSHACSRPSRASARARARGALGTRSGDLQQRMRASMCRLLQKSQSERAVSLSGPESRQLKHCRNPCDTQHTRKEPSNGRLFIHCGRRFRQPVGKERAVARAQRRAVPSGLPMGPSSSSHSSHAAPGGPGGKPQPNQ